MARHHVNPNTGNPGICKASKAGCPFGGESGEENHYSTAEEATQAAEKLMADQYSAVKASYRKKDGSALSGMNREMKKRIISEAAEGKNGLHPSVVAKAFSKDNDELIRKNVSEKFKSQKILREMSTDESARVRLAVAKSTNNPDVLKAMANDPDLKVRKAAIANQKTPVKVRKAALAALKENKIKPVVTSVNLQDSRNVERFKKAPLYRKSAIVSARKTTKVEHLNTVLSDGTLETSREVPIGEWIVTNPGGEEYAISEDKFKSKYEAGNDGKYQAKGVIRAFKNPTGGPVEIMAPWGEMQYGNADCYFAAGTNDDMTPTKDCYIIGNEELKETYGSF